MKHFTRTKEDFTCEHCGEKIIGNGYTNHCPKCLWSKHVDVNPGDRAESCGGMMEPISAGVSPRKTRIVQKCARCGFIRKQDSAKDDNQELLIELSVR